MLENIHQLLQKKLNTDIPQSQCLLLIESYALQAKLQDKPFHQNCAAYYRALHLSIKGELQKSNTILNQTIPYFRSKKHPVFLAAATNCLTKNKMDLGEIEEALQLAQSVLSLDYLSPLNRAKAERNLIHFLIILRANDKALLKCKQTLQTLSLKRSEERTIYVHILLDIAKIYLLNLESSNCILILEKIAACQTRYDIPQVSCILAKTFGAYYRVNNQFQSAEDQFKKALADSKNKDLAPEVLASSILLSDTYIAQTKYDKAESVLLEAFKKNKQGKQDHFLEVLNQLVVIYQRQGRTKKQKQFERELALYDT